ncbi:MAG: hypothetical protein N2505_00275 [Endomicrobia bacterium]|nr:hypothetical protein [Endomicrobiia bacterium]
MEIFEMEIENGAFITVPVYESHKRGKNWFARIEKNPRSPSGLDREFASHARGEYYYIVPNWNVGDVVEFGADYYTSGGRKHPYREYGVIIEINKEYWKVAIFDKKSEAFAYAKQMKQNNIQLNQIQQGGMSI